MWIVGKVGVVVAAGLTTIEKSRLYASGEVYFSLTLCFTTSFHIRYTLIYIIYYLLVFVVARHFLPPYNKDDTRTKTG